MKASSPQCTMFLDEKVTLSILINNVNEHKNIKYKILTICAHIKERKINK